MQRRKALFGGLAFVLVLAIVAGIFGVFGSSGDSSDQYPANYASTEETR